MGLSFRKTFEWTLHRPLPVILAVAVITVFFSWQLPNLSFKTSVYDLQIEDLSETAGYNDFKKLFGSDEIIRIAIKSRDVFDPLTFKKIEQLAEIAAEIDGVRRVISLPGIKKAVDTAGDWGMEKFYATVVNADLFRRNLISDNRKATALTLILKNEADSAAVIQRVNRMLAEAPADLKLYQIGMPLVSEALARFTEIDFFRLPPITCLIIAAIFLALFRKLSYVVLPLICVGVALIWTFGLMALLDLPLSMLTMIVPVFLVAVGTAYCLHIITAYQVNARTADSSVAAVYRTYANISLPTLLAVLTTVIGLGSLLANRIAAIQEFAVFSCFGMISILLILLIFLPAGLSYIRLPAQKHDRSNAATPFLDRFLDKIADLNLKHQKIVLPIIGIFTLVCLVGIFRIQVETNPVGYLKETAPVKRNFIDIYQDLSGSFPINIAMGGTQADFFENPKNLADIARLQEFLDTINGVDKTLSFADYLKLVNYTLNRFEPEYYRLPEEGFEVRLLLNNFKTILGEDVFQQFMNADLSKTNILLLTHMSSSRQFLQLREDTLAFVKQNFSKDLHWEVTGLGIVIAASNHQLTIGQIQSLSITMLLVFAIMFILFMSSKVGFIAILPNLFPIVTSFGIMGWFGIELSMVTSLIASIAIGLAVDDTIHYLVRYNNDFKKDLDKKRAIRVTLQHVGRPIIFTTITLCAGFSVLIFSSFKPTAIFGVMMIITSLAALIGDLILLPSLIQHIELVTLWDLVRLKLGAEPRMGIPLFKGLSRTQVHYILMAGSLKKIESGGILFHKGDASNSMYTILSGTMDVLDPVSPPDSKGHHGGQILINQLKSGDTLGEMGFLRSAPRSATVVATRPVELLQINWKMIKRLQWLYPPTAHKFFLNLMRITCDRLENLTECFSDLKLLEDANEPDSRMRFMKTLDTEIQRSQQYCANLSLCILRIGLEERDSDLNPSGRDRIVSDAGKFFTEVLRDWDTVHRYDGQSYALLMPQTTIEEAQRLCDRLKRVSARGIRETHGVSLQFEVGWAETSPGINATGSGLLAKASDKLTDLNLLRTS